MILDLHGQPLVGGIKRRTLRHRPRLQHAIHLQAEVIVQARSVVLLHHEPVSSFLPDLGWRFGRVLKLAFTFVFFQCHREPHLTTAVRSHRESQNLKHRGHRGTQSKSFFPSGANFCEPQNTLESLHRCNANSPKSHWSALPPSSSKTPASFS